MLEFNFRLRSISLLIATTLMLGSGCSKEMTVQDKTLPMRENAEIRGKRADLSPALRTVEFAAEAPASGPTNTEPLRVAIQNGARLFEIYCSACHDRAGTGEGLITRRGFPASPALAKADQPIGTKDSLLFLINHGQKSMPPFATRLSEVEKDLIIQYVRALQFSKQVPAAWLSTNDRLELEGKHPQPKETE